MLVCRLWNTSHFEDPVLVVIFIKVLALFSFAQIYEAFKNGFPLIIAFSHSPSLSLSLSAPRSTSACPFLSSLPPLFRGLFISLERWMRGQGHLQELIKPPANACTHTHTQTHACSLADTDIHADAETRRQMHTEI